jgi:hypothetical protein
MRARRIPPGVTGLIAALAVLIGSVISGKLHLPHTGGSGGSAGPTASSSRQERSAPRASAEPRPSRSSAPVSESAGERWSATRPSINETHLFEGEINHRGQPTGFHSRPGGKDPSGARLVRVIDRPNQDGVYTAEVEIRNASGNWLSKRSTLYPDRLSRQQVLDAVLHAWQNKTGGSSEQFRGPSGEGFTIEGYLLNGNINTAYPVYKSSNSRSGGRSHRRSHR